MTKTVDGLIQDFILIELKDIDNLHSKVSKEFTYQIIFSISALILLALLTLLFAWSIANKISNPIKNSGERILIWYVKIIEVDNQQVMVKNRRGDIFYLYPVDNIEQNEYYSFFCIDPISHFIGLPYPATSRAF